MAALPPPTALAQLGQPGGRVGCDAGGEVVEHHVALAALEPELAPQIRRIRVGQGAGRQSPLAGQLQRRPYRYDRRLGARDRGAAAIDLVGRPHDAQRRHDGERRQGHGQQAEELGTDRGGAHDSQRRGRCLRPDQLVKPSASRPDQVRRHFGPGQPEGRGPFTRCRQRPLRAPSGGPVGSGITMEIGIIIAVVAVVILGAVAFAARRPARGGVLEPPPPPEAPPAEPVDEELAAQVEDALAAVHDEASRATTLEAPPPAPEAPAPPAVRPSFRDRLAKARGALGGYLGSIRSRKVDAETWEELEEALIRADVGVATTQRVLDDLQATAKAEGITEPEVMLDRLKSELKGVLAEGDRSLRFEPGRPNVWLFVGVNGVGKTTTIGKIARRQLDQGRSVIMAAADTFRAAAPEQLGLWAERTGADIVRGSEGGDPSAVVFDAVQRAAARGNDLVLADTAGRLHTKTNLMDELRKVRRVADREPGTVTEVLLVLDATTGQNGLAQAQQFTEAVDVTGVVLTKLDGSAKGGIAVAIQASLGIPIKLVGLGETVDDLVEFDPDEFVEALFA